MRSNFLIVCFYLLTLSSCNDNEDEIRSVVHKWNNLHNNSASSTEFNKIYAPTVLFYGRETNAETCYAKKEAFLNSFFHQEIISPITIKYYSSGSIKCDFTKRAIFKKKTREYLCYLLLKKIDGTYLITGESDLLSDQRRNVQLTLGKEIMKPGTRTLIFIFSTIVVLFFLFFWLWKRQKKAKAIVQAEWEEIYATTTVNKIVEEPTDLIITKVKAAVLEEMKTILATAPVEEKKGTAFEKYVVEKFDEKYFELKEWRSDKYHKGHYASSSRLPDLEYVYRSKRHYKEFAVECKWRAGFYKYQIDWVTADKLAIYRKYEQERQQRIFIVLGIGGTEIDPKAVYIVPLKHISRTTLSESWLRRYLRYKNDNFFLNVDEMELR